MTDREQQVLRAGRGRHLAERIRRTELEAREEDRIGVMNDSSPAERVRFARQSVEMLVELVGEAMWRAAALKALVSDLEAFHGDDEDIDDLTCAVHTVYEFWSNLPNYALCGQGQDCGEDEPNDWFLRQLDDTTFAELERRLETVARRRAIARRIAREL